MLGTAEERARRAYHARFHAEPECVASAPGRINLIGEHTDYNGGHVMPCAVDRRVAVALGHGQNSLYSADFEETHAATTARTGRWTDYPSGILWALRARGHTVPDIQAAFAGDVPRGAGLSSSAAIEAATALALAHLLALGLPRQELALLCQQAENAFVGVKSGIMDQYASLLCEAGAALLIDCRSLSAQLIPLDLAAAGLTLLVGDTRQERTLAATGYNQRRQTCERAALHLGVASLRDAHLEDLRALRGEELRRARHVITENARVLAAAQALRGGDFAAFGALMYASHASLRDDFAVSTPALDAFVQRARAAGALGARLTGAGFGGCAVALLAPTAADALVATLPSAFAARGLPSPTVYRFCAAAGARVAQ